MESVPCVHEELQSRNHALHSKVSRSFIYSLNHRKTRTANACLIFLKCYLFLVPFRDTNVSGLFVFRIAMEFKVSRTLVGVLSRYVAYSYPFIKLSFLGFSMF